MVVFHPTVMVLPLLWLIDIDDTAMIDASGSAGTTADGLVLPVGVRPEEANGLAAPGAARLFEELQQHEGEWEWYLTTKQSSVEYYRLDSDGQGGHQWGESRRRHFKQALPSTFGKLHWDRAPEVYDKAMGGAGVKATINEQQRQLTIRDDRLPASSGLPRLQFCWYKSSSPAELQRYQRLLESVRATPAAHGLDPETASRFADYVPSTGAGARAPHASAHPLACERREARSNSPAARRPHSQAPPCRVSLTRCSATSS